MLGGEHRRPPRIALALAVSTRAFMRHSEPTAYELSNVVLRKSVALELPPGFEEHMRSGTPLAPERRRSIRRRAPRAPALSAARRRVAHMPLFRTLLPSFIRTASRGYAYTFVVVLDRDDPLVEELGGSEEGVQRLLRSHFDAAVGRARWGGGGGARATAPSPPPLPRLVVRLAPRDAAGGEPARRQGEAVIHAYLDEGADYVFRLNDDTQLLTAHWAELLVGTLQQQGNIGVVGPTCLDGNQDILTHEMTHLTHLSLFLDDAAAVRLSGAVGSGSGPAGGCAGSAHDSSGAAEAAMRAQLAANRERLAYYPPNFTAWFADEWIDRVYRPVGFSRRLASVRVAHQWHPQHAPGGKEWGVWSALRDALRGREFHQPKSRYYGAPADADLLRRVLPAGWRTVQRALLFKRSCRRVIAMVISPVLPPPERIAAAKAVADSALVVAKLMPGWTLRVYVQIGGASDSGIASRAYTTPFVLSPLTTLLSLPPPPSFSPPPPLSPPAPPSFSLPLSLSLVAHVLHSDGARERARLGARRRRGVAYGAAL